MKKPTHIVVRSLSVLLLITSFLISSPAWSGPGDKKQPVQGSLDKGVLEQKNVKSDKGGKTAKGKIVKKVGTTAAVGVAGKKVTSIIKPNIKETEE